MRFGWFPQQQSVASKRARAARDLATLRKQNPAMSPVVVEGRKIAATFWGKAWCENLERYSDFANRLPRGRSYVRNGLVLDLQVAPGVVSALVSGTDVYETRVSVTPLPKTRWRAVCQDVSGAIDSVIELLQGQLSDRVMTRLCAEKTGLFPAPREIQFQCSCPDWAWMCKHVAAVLYGIGARLDHEPALLFTLRKVKESDLVDGAGTRAAAGLARRRPGKGGSAPKVVDDAALGDVFGIDIAPVGAGGAGAAGAAGASGATGASRATGAAGFCRPGRRAKKATKKKTPKKAAKKKARTKLTPAARQAIVDAAKRRWAKSRREARKAGSG